MEIPLFVSIHTAQSQQFRLRHLLVWPPLNIQTIDPLALENGLGSKKKLANYIPINGALSHGF